MSFGLNDTALTVTGGAVLEAEQDRGRDARKVGHINDRS